MKKVSTILIILSLLFAFIASCEAYSYAYSGGAKTYKPMKVYTPTPVKVVTPAKTTSQTKTSTTNTGKPVSNSKPITPVTSTNNQHFYSGWFCWLPFGWFGAKHTADNTVNDTNISAQ